MCFFFHLCRNEFLAVRNADGGFYLCQAMHNVYKSSPKIRIRWLSEEPTNPNMFCMDFCDSTDIDCVLTSVTLNKSIKSKYELAKEERARIESILKKALDVEQGIVARPEVTEENPDGCEYIHFRILDHFIWQIFIFNGNNEICLFSSNFLFVCVYSGFIPV